MKTFCFWYDMPGELGREEPGLEVTRKPITFRLAKKNQSESYIYWRECGGTLCRLLKELFGAFKVYFHSDISCFTRPFHSAVSNGKLVGSYTNSRYKTRF